MSRRWRCQWGLEGMAVMGILEQCWGWDTQGRGHSGQRTLRTGDIWGRGHWTVAGARPARGPASRGLRLSAHVSSSRAVI